MSQKSIVVIDDEENVCNVLKRTLEVIGGYRVSTATNGKEGLKLVRKKLPDLILLDILMPVMDGYQVLKRLKNDTRTMSIPVVVLSAETSEAAQIKGARLYTDLYLTKPINPNNLLSKIEQVFARRHI